MAHGLPELFEIKILLLAETDEHDFPRREIAEGGDGFDHAEFWLVRFENRRDLTVQFLVEFFQFSGERLFLRHAENEEWCLVLVDCFLFDGYIHDHHLASPSGDKYKKLVAE